MRAAFLDTYADTYYRNNKRGGCKHIRCFPRCTGGRHRTGGFCGAPVRVVVSLPPPSPAP